LTFHDFEVWQFNPKLTLPGSVVQLLSGSTVEADFHEKLLKQIGATFLPARLLLPQIRYNKVLPAQNV